MPAKNRVKQYTEEGYYHLYNRGVEKRLIFQDQQDYSVFLSYLKEYLLPKDVENLQAKLTDPFLSPAERDKIKSLLRMNNFADEIALVAYCLMPNHFHFLVKQKSASAIDKFMNSLSTRYTMYFNKRYRRVGSLYQGVYKAILIQSEVQFLHLTRYIHKQALSIPSLFGSGQPSSYHQYIGKQKTDWVKPEDALTYFSTTTPSLTYKAFTDGEDEPKLIHKLIVEEWGE